VKANPLLALCLMMFLQPRPKGDRFCEKDWTVFRGLHLTQDGHVPANFPIA
jgi:hypothetical protein